MPKAFLVLFFVIVGCSSNKCLKDNSDLHSRFIDMFKADERALSQANKDDLKPYKSELQLKERIFIKICKYLNNKKKFLYLEQISAIDMSRIGLIYLYDEDKFHYFIVDHDLDITVNGLYTGYDDLKRVATIVKSDFDKESKRLGNYFQSISMADVPSLQLALIDLNKNKKEENLVSFRFSGNVLNDEDFNKEFPRS